MKKQISFFLFYFFVLGLVFCETINSKKGYINVSWGSTVNDAKKAEYKLDSMNTSNDKEYLSKLYIEPVEAFKVTSKDKNVIDLQFHYYEGRLVSVIETIKVKGFYPQKLESRYGNFSKQGIFLAGDQYTDVIVESDGSVSYSSISISNSTGNITATMYDWNTYKNISFEGQKLTHKKTIADELQDLAKNLIEDVAITGKPKFALIPLITDYGNTLVDNYVTDALTEAMFNTKKISIVERSNIELILSEQKFQSSGLVNEATAKEIGKLAGVDYVCYGTLKDIGSSFNVNARVVDVETGELCAISRTTITKDEYLKNQPQKAISSTKAIKETKEPEKAKGPEKTKELEKTSPITTSQKKSTVISNNAWKVTTYNDTFTGTHNFIFVINSSDDKMLFFKYIKAANPANSRVLSGIHWTKNNHYNDNNVGTYDIKGDNGVTLTKKLSDVWTCTLNAAETNTFYYVWNPKEGSRWLVELMIKSESVAVRRNGLSRRFQTAGLLSKMREFGITWEEINAAIANEEF